MELIRAENLIKRYGEKHVVDGVSLTINEGQFVSVVGASGSGKTTLIGMLATLIQPSGGKVFICGEDITGQKGKKIRDIRRHIIGYCYQSGNLIGELSVKQNILLPLRLSGAPIDKELFDYLVTIMGLKEHLNKLPSKLSGGESQRSAIARSLIKKPKVVFLDEPIGNLDSRSGENVTGLLHVLNKELGTAIVQVTHNPQSTLNTDILHISDGKLVSCD